MAKSLDLRPRASRRTGSSKRLAAVPIKVRKVTHPELLPTAAPTTPQHLSFLQKIVASSAGLALLVVILIVFLILPEARIQVLSRTEPKTADFEIRVDKNQTQPQMAELVVPGKFMEQEISGTKTFPATGAKNVGYKASGFVYVYNFSKTTLILKKETTVLTISGRKYFFTQDVGNIRPTALIGLEEQEVDSTSLIPPVPLVAEEPGEEYNLKKGTRLEIENEVFGKQPKVLYAAVAEDVAGGTTKQIKVVTAADVTSAYTALQAELIESSKNELELENSDLKLLPQATASEILEQTVSAQAGTEIPEFQATLKLKLRALAYNESDIRTVITERIKKLLPVNKTLKEGKEGRVQSNFVYVSLEQGSGILNNHFESQVVYKVDTQELLPRIRGKNVEEIREILLSRPEISGVNIKFYPFWVKKAPKFGKKIFIEVKENPS